MINERKNSIVLLQKKVEISAFFAVIIGFKDEP